MNIAQTSGLSLFIPQVYDIVWSTIILVGIAVFFYKFFMPKLNAIFDERAHRIEDGIARAEETQREANEVKRQYEEHLSKAVVEASRIRDDARDEASHIISDARVKAQNDAEQIAQNAKKSIETQRRQAITSLKQEVGSIAVSLAGKIVAQELQEEQTQTAMVDHLIDQLEKK